MSDTRRRLPSVDALLRTPEVTALLGTHARNVVVAAVREVIDVARHHPDDAHENLAAHVAKRVVTRETPSLVNVINATGVVLHTNLGRAPIAPVAAAAMLRAATGYSTLEYDLANGERGSRLDHCRGLLAHVTGADDGMAVVNGAGALVLALNALAGGREVILSRGELIEIGGSFRIPDILAKAGVVLREVGTTNRTHLEDYERALGPATGAILTVHRSNFQQLGFTATADHEAIAALAKRAGVPYIVDVGSGLLHDLAPWGLSGEPIVPQVIKHGADLVIMSGDKLLGAPQAGCIVGRRDLIGRCRANPFARAMRCDKVTLAGLEATLALHRDLESARNEIPVLTMLTLSAETLEHEATTLGHQLSALDVKVSFSTGSSAVGGGAFPEVSLPTTLVTVDPAPMTAEELARRLRQGNPAVIVRVHEGQVILDPRTLRQDEYAAVATAMVAALQA